MESKEELLVKISNNNYEVADAMGYIHTGGVTKLTISDLLDYNFEIVVDKLYEIYKRLDELEKK